MSALSVGQRLRASRLNLFSEIVTDYDFLCSVIHRSEPEVIIHFAEQPSAPYSMRGFKEAHLTVSNNVLGTLALAHAVKELNREIHIVKLGTMGEYRTQTST